MTVRCAGTATWQLTGRQTRVIEGPGFDEVLSGIARQLDSIGSVAIPQATAVWRPGRKVPGRPRRRGTWGHRTVKNEELARWYGAPSCDVHITYPTGMGGPWGDEYSIKVQREFGLQRLGEYPPGTRLRAALIELLDRVTGRGGTAAIPRVYLTVVRTEARATAITARRHGMHVSEQVRRAAVREAEGRATDRDRAILARVASRKILGRKRK